MVAGITKLIYIGQAAPQEKETKMQIWITKNAKSNHSSAWYFNMKMNRSFRLPMAQAELMIMTGEATLIEKPWWK
jgi:hypothetical protein